MIRDLLLNYIMGRYRKSLAIILSFICTLSTIRYVYVINSQMYLPENLFFLLVPLPFVLALYNTPVIGMPAVDKNSSDMDIFLRFIGVFGMLLLLLGYVYLTFNPDLMNSL